MQLATRWRGGVAAGVLALVVGLASPWPALAAGPAVSDEPIQLVKGHIDAFNLVLNEDESVRLTLKEDETGSHVLRTPESVELFVKPDALTTVPSGVVPGLSGDVHHLPLTQNPDLIWPGWDSLSLAGVYGTGQAADVDINITDVSGPGEVFLWSQNAFGLPTPLLNDGRWRFPGTIHQNYLAHVHAAWAFTAPGTYKLTAHAEVTSPDGARASTSQTATYTFVVAERTALTPQAPTQDGNTVTIPDQRWMSYADDEGTALEPGELTLTEDLTVTAKPAYGFDLASGATDSWDFGYAAPPELSAPAPTITGAAVVGARLAVSAGNWEPEPVELAFQWLADGVVIPGATEPGYPVTVADLGRQLSVAVTGSKDGYASATRESEKTAKVAEGAAAVATVKPSISGTPAVGNTLTASSGTWNTSGLTFAYQWLREGTVINGATTASYKVVSADAGRSLSVRVTAGKPGLQAGTATSATVKAGKKLTRTPTPTISGTGKVGKTLKAKAGTWSPSKVTVKYQWLRDDQPIAKATKSSYKLAKADAGRRISVRVTGSKSGHVSVAKTSKARTMAKVKASVKASVPAKVAKGRQATVKVTVTAPVKNPTGTVRVTVNGATVKTTLTAAGKGKVSVKLPAIKKKGSYKVKTSFSPTGATAASTATSSTVSKTLKVR